MGNQIDSKYLYPVSSFVIHPNYNQSAPDEFDVAIITLSRTPKLDSQINVIQLPTHGPVVGEVCKLFGWGPESPGKKKHAYWLKYITAPVVDKTTCNIRFHGTITQNMFCTGENDTCKSVCTGDSGGPVACRANDTLPWKLYGVINMFSSDDRNATCPASRNKTMSAHASVWQLKKFFDEKRPTSCQAGIADQDAPDEDNVLQLLVDMLHAFLCWKKSGNCFFNGQTWDQTFSLIFNF